MWTMAIDSVVRAIDAASRVHARRWSSNPAAGLVMLEFPKDEARMVVSNQRIRFEATWPCMDARAKSARTAHHAVDLAHLLAMLKALRTAGGEPQLIIESIDTHADGTERLRFACGQAEARVRCALSAEVSGWFDRFEEIEDNMADVSALTPVVARVASANKLESRLRTEGGVFTAVALRVLDEGEAWVITGDGKNFFYAHASVKDVPPFARWAMLPCEVCALIKNNATLKIGDRSAQIRWRDDDLELCVDARQIAGAPTLDQNFLNTRVLNSIAWSVDVDRSELEAACLLAATTTNDYNTGREYVSYAVLKPIEDEEVAAGVKVLVSAEQARCGATACPVHVATSEGTLADCKIGRAGEDARPALDAILRWLAVEREAGIVTLSASPHAPCLVVRAEHESGVQDIGLLSIVIASTAARSDAVRADPVVDV